MEENEEFLLRFVCSKFVEGDNSCCCFGGHYLWFWEERKVFHSCASETNGLIDAFMPKGIFFSHAELPEFLLANPPAAQETETKGTDLL